MFGCRPKPTVLRQKRFGWKGQARLFFLLVVLLLAFGGNLLAAAEQPIKIISASATSASPDSLPIPYLLDPSREGRWRPAGRDGGVNEGLFFQFAEPVLLDWIELKIRHGDDEYYKFSLYLDGQILTAEQKEATEDRWYGVSREKSGAYYIYTFGTYGGADWEIWWGEPLRIKARSVYIKIERAKTKPEIVSVRFKREGRDEPLPVELPKTVKGEAVATSTLAPETAYSVLNLFDSRLDFAWSTEGKTTDGVGEQIRITFAEPQNLTGLMVWNGYQRSRTHYLANARPAKLKIIANKGEEEFVIAVKDQMDGQRILFPKLLKGVRYLDLEITAVYPGGSYRDLLLSELRFLDAADRVVLLETPPQEIKITENLAAVVDVSLAPYMFGLSDEADKYYKSDFYLGYYPYRGIRFRANGSFVIYCGGNQEIMEGNWEPTADGVRIFGKRYITNPRASEYLQAVREKTAVRIFQANVTIKPVAALTYEEARQYLRVMFEERKSYWREAGRNFNLWWLGIEPFGEVVLKGKNEEELFKKAYAVACEQGAILLASPLFVDLFLPEERTLQTYNNYWY